VLRFYGIGHHGLYSRNTREETFYEKDRIYLVAATGLASALFEDLLECTWRTPIDDNGNSGIVVVAPCGVVFCGTLSQSFESLGVQMASPNIG